ERAYPGDDGRRQAVHTDYILADRYTSDTPQQWGQQALDAVRQQGSLTELAELVVDDAQSAEYRQHLAQLVERKLSEEPIEDLRIDFEGGYGRRSDTEEDQHAIQAAQYVAQSIEAGSAPHIVGIRFKCLEGDVRARVFPTLEMYVRCILQKTIN